MTWRSTHPTLPVVFFHKLAVVVVIEGWVTIHALLFAKLVVLSFCTVHCSINNLRTNRKQLVRKTTARTSKSHITILGRRSQQKTGGALEIFKILNTLVFIFCKNYFNSGETLLSFGSYWLTSHSHAIHTILHVEFLAALRKRPTLTITLSLEIT